MRDRHRARTGGTADPGGRGRRPQRARPSAAAHATKASTAATLATPAHRHTGRSPRRRRPRRAPAGTGAAREGHVQDRVVGQRAAQHGGQDHRGVHEDHRHGEAEEHRVQGRVVAGSVAQWPRRRPRAARPGPARRSRPAARRRCSGAARYRARGAGPRRRRPATRPPRAAPSAEEVGAGRRPQHGGRGGGQQGGERGEEPAPGVRSRRGEGASSRRSPAIVATTKVASHGTISGDGEAAQPQQGRGVPGERAGRPGPAGRRSGWRRHSSRYDAEQQHRGDRQQEPCRRRVGPVATRASAPRPEHAGASSAHRAPTATARSSATRVPTKPNTISGPCTGRRRPRWAPARRAAAARRTARRAGASAPAASSGSRHATGTAGGRLTAAAGRARPAARWSGVPHTRRRRRRVPGCRVGGRRRDAPARRAPPRRAARTSRPGWPDQVQERAGVQVHHGGAGAGPSPTGGEAEFVQDLEDRRPARSFCAGAARGECRPQSGPRVCRRRAGRRRQGQVLDQRRGEVPVGRSVARPRFGP